MFSSNQVVSKRVIAMFGLGGALLGLGGYYLTQWPPAVPMGAAFGALLGTFVGSPSPRK